MAQQKRSYSIFPIWYQEEITHKSSMVGDEQEKRKRIQFIKPCNAALLTHQPVPSLPQQRGTLRGHLSHCLLEVSVFTLGPSLVWTWASTPPPAHIWAASQKATWGNVRASLKEICLLWPWESVNGKIRVSLWQPLQWLKTEFIHPLWCLGEPSREA